MSSELCQFDDNRLRFLGFDDVYLSRTVRTCGGTYGEGVADDFREVFWTYRIRLGPDDHDLDTLDWALLVPAQIETEWLGIDTEARHLEIGPPTTSMLS